MDIEKFKKHINKPIKIKLEATDGTEDEFEFLPLNTEQFATMMILGDKLQISPDIATAKELIVLYKDIVKTSYPELEEKILDQFIVNHFLDFEKIITKLAPNGMDKNKVDLIKKMQKKAKEQKNGNAPK